MWQKKKVKMMITSADIPNYLLKFEQIYFVSNDFLNFPDKFQTKKQNVRFSKPFLKAIPFPNYYKFWIVSNSVNYLKK